MQSSPNGPDGPRQRILVGARAITYAEAFPERVISLNKSACPKSGAVQNIWLGEARLVAKDDPSLIWALVEANPAPIWTVIKDNPAAIWAIIEI